MHIKNINVVCLFILFVQMLSSRVAQCCRDQHCHLTAERAPCAGRVLLCVELSCSRCVVHVGQTGHSAAGRAVIEVEGTDPIFHLEAASLECAAVHAEHSLLFTVDLRTQSDRWSSVPLLRDMSSSPSGQRRAAVQARNLARDRKSSGCRKNTQ